MKNMEILISTGMSQRDAEKHLKAGAEINVVEEMIDELSHKSQLDETEKEILDFLKQGLASKKDTKLYDNDLTWYNGTAYYIEYCL